MNNTGAIAHTLLPVWFAIPSLTNFKSVRMSSCAAPRTDFSGMHPGHGGTYTSSNELSYYRQYASARFGLTQKKGGWDCTRHYEIIASGCVPYFVGLHLVLDSLTMYALPKRMLLQALELPGVPSESLFKDPPALQEQLKLRQYLKLDHSKFNTSAYCNLAERLIEYSDTALTAEALGKYVVTNIQASVLGEGTPLRMLIVTGDEADMQATLTYQGLYLVLGADSITTWTDNGHMRKRHAHADVMSSSYRRNPAWKNGGFTFEAKIPAIPEYSTNASEATVDAQLYERMQGRLASGWYNTILVTTRGNDNWDVKRSYGSQKLTALNEYIVRKHERNEPLAVVTLDGTDDVMLPNEYRNRQTPTEFHKDLARTPDMHFVRETERYHGLVKPPKVSLRHAICLYEDKPNIKGNEKHACNKRLGDLGVP